MTDFRTLEEDLTLMHIGYMYDFMMPLDYSAGLTAAMIENRKTMAIERYNNDPFFHARVNQIVAHAINVMKKHHERMEK